MKYTMNPAGCTTWDEWGIDAWQTILKIPVTAVDGSQHVPSINVHVTVANHPSFEGTLSWPKFLGFLCLEATLDPFNQWCRLRRSVHIFVLQKDCICPTHPWALYVRPTVSACQDEDDDDVAVAVVVAGCWLLVLLLLLLLLMMLLLMMMMLFTMLADSPSRIQNSNVLAQIFWSWKELRLICIDLNQDHSATVGTVLSPDPLQFHCARCATNSTSARPADRHA